MKKKRPVALFILLVIVGVFVCGGIVNAKGSAKYRETAKRLDLGFRCLTEMDYEQAVVEFDRAVSLDPKNISAYVGIALAKAEGNSGDVGQIISILSEGYERTESPVLQYIMTAVSQGQPLENIVTVKAEDEKKTISNNPFDTLKLLGSNYYTWDFNSCAKMFKFDYQTYAGQEMTLGSYNGYNINFDAKTEDISMSLDNFETEYSYKFINDSQMQIFTIDTSEGSFNGKALSEIELLFNIGASRAEIEKAYGLDQIVKEENTYYMFKSNIGTNMVMKWTEGTNSYLYMDSYGKQPLSLILTFENDKLTDVTYTCAVPNSLKNKVIGFIGNILN